MAGRAIGEILYVFRGFFVKRGWRSLPFIGLGFVLAVAGVPASTLQSSADGGALWARLEGAEIVLVGVSA